MKRGRQETGSYRAWIPSGSREPLKDSKQGGRHNPIYFGKIPFRPAYRKKFVTAESSQGNESLS